MAKIINDISTLLSLQKSGKPFVLLASAIWCGPCKVVKPFYEQMAKDYTNIMFYTLDVDSCTDLASLLQIAAMPTFIVFNGDGKEVMRQQGGKPNINEIVNAINTGVPTSAPPAPAEPVGINSYGDNYASF